MATSASVRCLLTKPRSTRSTASSAPTSCRLPADGQMQLGLHALGIGAGARPEVIRAVAKAAEFAGFARLWCGEHLVFVDRPASRYPYAADGRIAVPADADWLDPLLCLTYAAAATKTIGLATGVLLLGEHNPVLTAKQAATLDVLSGGRVAALADACGRHGRSLAELSIAVACRRWPSPGARTRSGRCDRDCAGRHPTTRSARRRHLGGRARRCVPGCQPLGAVTTAGRCQHRTTGSRSTSRPARDKAR
jgi:Luciferase-like monooxygenase